MSVSSVAYTYPCPSLGSEVLKTATAVVNPIAVSGTLTVEKIRDAYQALNVKYQGIQSNLFDALDKILPGFSSKKSAEDLVNFNEIAETYRLLNAEAECKEGAKAYKYYLKEIVSNLNQLTQAINEANKAIEALCAADITSDQAHELITKLEIYDKQAQEAVEAFASYSVCKTITMQRYTFASNYTDNCKFTGSSTYEQVETAYKDLTQPIVSVIGDSVTNLEDLRKLKVTKKCSVTRDVYTIYYTGVEKDEEGGDKIIYGDRYDSNTKVTVQSKDGDPTYQKEDNTGEIKYFPLALFDELTLLDKVKYIRLYYKHSAEDISKTEEYISNLWKSTSNTEKHTSNIASGLGNVKNNVAEIKSRIPTINYSWEYKKRISINAVEKIKDYISKAKENIQTIKGYTGSAEADRPNLAGYNIQSISEVEKGIQNINEHETSITNSISDTDRKLSEIKTDLENINKIISDLQMDSFFSYWISRNDVITINGKISDIEEQYIAAIEANITNIKTNITNIKEKDGNVSNTEKMSAITTDAANNSTFYIHERYVFPEDSKCGFPCIKRETNAGGPSDDPNYYVDDVNEVCCLELFYVGYLVNRDGAANALASFMEIKASAILQQIKLLSYRVKALQYYLKLLNRGFQYLNQAQNDDWGSNMDRARYVLQYVGSNTLHTLYQDNGQDEILVQKNSGTSGTANYTNNEFYAIPTTDEDVENFAARRGDSAVHLDPPPKALDTQLMAIDSILSVYGKAYNGSEYHTDFFNMWAKTYDTAIKNMESSLECVNKNIESLRTKVNTFDGSAASFRTKAYSIYNKLVNHIQ